MKKNILFIFSFLFILTGCSFNENNNYVDYNLSISDVYKEDINFYLSGDAYDKANLSSESMEFTLLNKTPKPLIYDDKVEYSKYINDSKNYVDVNLKYVYFEHQFIYNSFIINCFDNYRVGGEDDYFDIMVSGSFKCLNNFKKVNIKINTDYKIIENNGNHKNNEYSWIIDENNKDNVDIRFKISRMRSDMISDVKDYKTSKSKSENSDIIILIALVISLIVVIGGAYKICKKIEEKTEF